MKNPPSSPFYVTHPPFTNFQNFPTALLFQSRREKKFFHIKLTKQEKLFKHSSRVKQEAKQQGQTTCPVFAYCTVKKRKYLTVTRHAYSYLRINVK